MNKIAKALQTSQTNIRFWLRKHGLNTVNLSRSKDKKDCFNGLECLHCSSKLTGAKSKFCGPKCKRDYHYINSIPENGNTNERQKRTSKERKLTLIEMSGGCCSICGYKKNYSALQFHHLNPEDKVFNLDGRKLSNTNWESIKKEWEKCQLLCSNCHAEIHNPDKEMKG